MFFAFFPVEYLYNLVDEHVHIYVNKILFINGKIDNCFFSFH